MGHLILNDLRDDVIEKLNTRAATNGRTAEEELRAILEEALSSPREDFWTLADRLRAETRARNLPDSAELIRQDRDSRAGLLPELDP